METVALNARIPKDLKKRLEIAKVERDVNIQDAVTAAIEAWVDGAADTPSIPSPRAIPGPMDGLTADQYWTIQNLSEILTAHPSGAEFRMLYSALEIAVSEWRKIRSEYHGTQAPSSGPRHRRKRAV